ncbi:MAG: DUF4031 domain-containing protein [Pseudomonadota bacterium]
MTVYVDDMYIQFGRMKMCHLMSDEPEGVHDEIHEFANRIGMRRSWFDEDHYDVSISLRKKAVEAGAIEISWREMVKVRRAKYGRERRTP